MLARPKRIKKNLVQSPKSIEREKGGKYKASLKADYDESKS